MIAVVIIEKARISSFRWNLSWYQDKTATINKIKTRLLQPIYSKRPMKRAVGGRKVTISFRGKIIKITTKK